VLDPRELIVNKQKIAEAVAKMKLWPWVKIGRVAGVLAIMVFAVLLYRHFFIVPQQLRQENAQAKIEVGAAQGEVTVTREVMDNMQDRARVQETVRIIVKENTREIRSAPGASNRVPPAVHDAFVASIGRLREQADQRERQADQLPDADQ
jgi:hypothetical protein